SAEKSVAIVVPAYGTPRARVVATRARTGSLLVVELHREEAVRVGGAGAQCCGDHDGAGGLLLGGTGLLRVADVRIEAVRALGGGRARDLDQFAELHGHHLVAGIEDGRVDVAGRLHGPAGRLPERAQVLHVAGLLEVLQSRALLGDLVREQTVRVG